MVNDLQEIPIKSLPVSSSLVTSVIASICASSIPSIHLSDDKCQEILEEFPGTNYGGRHPSKILVKIPADVTLTLHNAKFPEKTPGISNVVNFLVGFLSG